MTEAAVPVDAAPSVAPAVAAFMVAALVAAGALLAYAQLAGITLLECDRASDSCVLSEARPYSKDELDRFPMAKLREATHFERTQGKSPTLNCVALRVDSRAQPVEICGRAGPDYAARINAFVADRALPRFIAELDTGMTGRMLAKILFACALVPLAVGLFLLRRVLRAR